MPAAMPQLVIGRSGTAVASHLELAAAESRIRAFANVSDGGDRFKPAIVAAIRMVASERVAVVRWADLMKC